MDQRVIDFISALRSAGVRVSLAESLDAMRATEQTGSTDRDLFRAVLQATLIKDQRNMQAFQQFFPLYFGGSPPPLQQPGAGGSMNQQDQQLLEQLLEQMLQQMTPQQLAELFRSMMSGQQMSSEQMQAMLNELLPGQMPAPNGMSAARQSRMTQRALRQMSFDQLEELLQELLEELRASGMSEAALQELEQTARENMRTLAQQIEAQVGEQLREQLQQAAGEGEGQQPISQLLDRPFEYLNDYELEQLRGVVTRLAAQLRSRVALRQRRGKSGSLDAKRTIRTNMRFGGVPMIIRQRQRHLKPRLTVVCDLSYSMRPVASFMMLLIYALQDQISRTRSFAFIHDITDISTYFSESRPERAIEQVMHDVRPPYSYATDLGNSLATFGREHMDCVDCRTTLIVLGDGRNNHNDPNLRMFEMLKRRARRVVWFNPEPPHMWGMYDPGSLSSDMLEYAQLCDAVHHVSNLRQLVDAVDSLFAR